MTCHADRSDRLVDRRHHRRPYGPLNVAARRRELLSLAASQYVHGTNRDGQPS